MVLNCSGGGREGNLRADNCILLIISVPKTNYIIKIYKKRVQNRPYNPALTRSITIFLLDGTANQKQVVLPNIIHTWFGIQLTTAICEML
jgi:hypothetical protein